MISVQKFVGNIHLHLAYRFVLKLISIHQLHTKPWGFECQLIVLDILNTIDFELAYLHLFNIQFIFILLFSQLLKSFAYFIDFFKFIYFFFCEEV